MATRLLGLDPGTTRCGVAITDSALTMAFPRDAWAADASLLDRVARLLDDEGVGGIVIGRPVALSGNETASTRHADGLFEAVRERFVELTVVQWDERLTTYEAQQSLSAAGVRARDHRGRLDSAAAVIMLQNYVDALHPR